MSTKGKWLTIAQKCELIEQHRHEPTASYTQLALWAKTRFDLSVPPSRQTVRNILKNTVDIEAKRERGNGLTKGRNPCVRSQELEDRLEDYARECQAHDVRLTRRLLNARAREILDGMENAPALNLSVGWLTRFMKRHGLRLQKEREGPVEFESRGQAALPVVNVNLGQQEPLEAGREEERARVDQLRQKYTKRLRQIEKEAREIRKLLRRLDDASNNEQQAREAGSEL